MTTIDWDNLGIERTPTDEELPKQPASPAIVHPARAQWLMRRREMITASDVPAIMNEDPFRTEADVFLEKTGQAEVAETEPMRWGRRMEDAIASGYVAITHRRVHPELPYEVVTHPDIPWLGATLDRGVTCDGYNIEEPGLPGPADAKDLGALELKLTNDASQWEDEAPVHHQIQLTIQMACASRVWGSLCAFVSIYRPVVWFDHLFDPEMFALMVPRLEEFRGFVQRREFTPTDPERFSRAAIRRLWPVESGASIVLEPPDHAMALVQTWEAQREAESQARAAKEQAEDELRILMKDATTGFLRDGTSLNLKTVKETQIAASVRAAYRMLRRFTPKGMRRRKE